MPKPFYCDFVRHALRFYARTSPYGIPVVFKTDVDRVNWFAVRNVMNQMTEEDVKIITKIYASYEELPVIVKSVAEDYNVSEGAIWDKMKTVERDIAKERGLS